MEDGVRNLLIAIHLMVSSENWTASVPSSAQTHAQRQAVSWVLLRLRVLLLIVPYLVHVGCLALLRPLALIVVILRSIHNYRGLRLIVMDLCRHRYVRKLKIASSWHSVPILQITHLCCHVRASALLWLRVDGSLGGGS